MNMVMWWHTQWLLVDGTVMHCHSLLRRLGSRIPGPPGVLGTVHTSSVTGLYELAWTEILIRIMIMMTMKIISVVVVIRSSGGP